MQRAGVMLLLLSLPAMAQQEAVRVWSFDAGHGCSGGSATLLVSVIGQEFATPAAGGGIRSAPGILPAWTLPAFPLSVTDRAQAPAVFALEQSYPNPFNPAAAIGFRVAEWSQVNITVYDLLGRRVAVLVDDARAPGAYSVTFDASNLASGTYIYRMTAGGRTATRRMLLLK